MLSEFLQIMLWCFMAVLLTAGAIVLVVGVCLLIYRIARRFFPELH